MQPLISIIIPVYNVEKYLEICIESVMAQTYRNLEIILVDDGSPDTCGIICDEYQKRDSRIKVIHKKNGGLSDARNAGLNIATGKYIGFVDSDDWIEPSMMEYLYNGLIGNNAQIAICNVIMVKRGKLYQNNYPETIYTTSEALKELFTDKIENYAWNKLYLAELWQNVRFPVGKNFEDILTVYKTFERASKIIVLNQGKYYYRIRTDSISGTRNYMNRLHIYQAFCERYKDVSPRMPQYREALVRRIRKYYCHEICYQIIHDKKKRYLNENLLRLLADFIKDNRRDIYESCNFGWLERKKFNAFCKCSVSGCKVSYFYHCILKTLDRKNFENI